MGEVAVSTNQTEYSRGITFTINPTGVLNNDTYYNFSFDLISTYYAIQNAGFNLLNTSSGATIASNFCTVETGCISSVNFSTANYEYLTMAYYWTIDGNISGGNHTWWIKHTAPGNYSWYHLFMTDLAKLTGKSGWNDFTKSLIAFIIIFMLTGVITYMSGMYSPLAIMIEIFAFTAAFEYLNFITPIPHTPSYFITVIMALVVMGYYIYENWR